MDLKHIEFIKELVEVAEKDIEAANILYEKSLFAQSIYFLQQSVEKLAKAHAVLSGNLKPSEIAKEIGHLTPKFFTLQLANLFERLQGTTTFLKENAEENDSIKRLIESIENFQKFNGFLRKELPKGLLKFSPDAARISSKKLEELLEENIKLFDKTRIQSFFDKINEINDEEQFLTDEEIIELKKQNIENAKLGGTMIRLSQLAMFTYPHVTLSRYPNDELSPKEYTEELGIVSCYQKISEIQKETIRIFKEDSEYFEQNP